MKIIENNGIVAKLTFHKYFLEIHVRTGEDALLEKDLYCVNVYVKISEWLRKPFLILLENNQF